MAAGQQACRRRHIFLSCLERVSNHQKEERKKCQASSNIVGAHVRRDNVRCPAVRVRRHEARLPRRDDATGVCAGPHAEVSADVGRELCRARHLVLSDKGCLYVFRRENRLRATPTVVMIARMEM